MSDSSRKNTAARRGFLKGVAAAGAAPALLGPLKVAADKPASTAPSASMPTNHVANMESGVPPGYTDVQAARYFVNHPGSDVMVDTLRALDIDYVAANPGSSFRGLHESITTYGGNAKPEFLTCLHEESAVAMGHGYAKAAGKPLAVACHGTVGLQHAAMAVYNAWCDRVPVIVLAGNHLDASERKPGVEWAHAAQDAAKLVRDFTKWDDAPISLQHFTESMVRAYKIATTPPMGPVVIVLDAMLQEHAVGHKLPTIPALAPTIPPQGDAGALQAAAELLVAAESPLILADRVARSPAGMQSLVELAEALQAPVVDKLGRMNFPSDHYLNHSGLNRQLTQQADVILGLELEDFWGSVSGVRDIPQRPEVRRARDNVKLISIGVGDLYLKANYQDFQRYLPVDLSIAGDAETTLPALTEAVKRATTKRHRSRFGARTKAHKDAHLSLRQRAQADAAYAWDASPVSTARLCMELWEQIKEHDWALVSQPFFQSFWPQRLWTMNQHHHFNGGSGGYGVGYGAPAAVGAALAHRSEGRLSVNIQPDGDLLYAPGVLWTAAHHDIPLLSVMHNNGGYHQEIMHLHRMAANRQRGIADRAKIGNVFEDPGVDYGAMAKSMGMWASGPINNPDELAPALRKAIDVVRQGEPALVDVVCQPR